MPQQKTPTQPTSDSTFVSSIELRPHQVKAVKEMHNGCVLAGGVGTGKSFTAVAYYVENEAPKDIYVFTTAVKRDSLDWEKDFAAFGITSDRTATTFGRLNVDSWNNITKYEDVTNAFLIFDEQRVVGSGSWAKGFIRLAKANRWVLLSATPGDSWMDYIPLFVANSFYKNRTEFLRRHVVYNHHAKFPQVDHYVEESTLQRHRRAILVSMPYQRHTTRHIKTIPVGYDRELYDRVLKQRWDVFLEEPLKDVAGLFRTLRKVANTDYSRLGVVGELMEKHPKLIVFYNFDYELELLRTFIASTHTTFAERNGHKHQPIPKTKTWVYLVQYTAGAEAWNCIETDAMCFYSLTYSYKVFEQSQGRLDRLNTPFTELHYYVLRSKASIDLAIWKALALKKNFSESANYDKFSRSAHI